MLIEERIRELGFKLPPCPEPAASYVPAVLNNDLVFVAGQTPKREGELVYKGKLGMEISLDEGYMAARIAVLRSLSAVKSVVGDLDHIVKVVKMIGYVNCTEDFEDHAKVINGASDLLEDIFGEEGKHARVSVGTSSLPGGAPVEIELIVKVQYIE